MNISHCGTASEVVKLDRSASATRFTIHCANANIMVSAQVQTAIAEPTILIITSFYIVTDVTLWNAIYQSALSLSFYLSLSISPRSLPAPIFQFRTWSPIYVESVIACRS